MPASPAPLANDFAERLTALQTEAAEGGHSDIDYIIEMAAQIARTRIEAQQVMPAIVDSEILRPAAAG